jgi:hypothetical protein
VPKGKEYKLRAREESAIGDDAGRQVVEQEFKRIRTYSKIPGKEYALVRQQAKSPFSTKHPVVADWITCKPVEDTLIRAKQTSEEPYCDSLQSLPLYVRKNPR